MASKTAHMRFVDDTVDQGNVELLIVAPLEMIFNYHAMSLGVIAVLVGSPWRPIRYHAGVGVEQTAGGVKALNPRLRIGLHIEAKSVVRPDIKAFDEDVPHLADAVDVGVQGDFALN